MTLSAISLLICSATKASILGAMIFVKFLLDQ
jgi:hypothetical protein